MKNLCQIKYLVKKNPNRARQGVPNSWALPLSFSTMDHQQRVHNICHKSYKNFKKNLDKISAIRKEFWFPKILSHRI